MANGDASGDDGAAAKLVKKRKIMEPEYPMRVSDRGNKGMASSAFLADWLSTHYEPKDETEGEIASKVTFGVHVELKEPRITQGLLKKLWKDCHNCIYGMSCPLPISGA